MKKPNKSRLLNFALSTLFLSLAAVVTPVQAGKTLSGDEIKALISGKTVYVTLNANGAKWKSYFAADGSALLSNSSDKQEWRIDENGRHCNTGVPLACAPIVDNGDGTFSRVKPDGSVAVTWTKIVDGKDF